MWHCQAVADADSARDAGATSVVLLLPLVMLRSRQETALLPAATAHTQLSIMLIVWQAVAR